MSENLEKKAVIEEFIITGLNFFTYDRDIIWYSFKNVWETRIEDYYVVFIWLPNQKPKIIITPTTGEQKKAWVIQGGDHLESFQSLLKRIRTAEKEKKKGRENMQSIWLEHLKSYFERTSD